MPLCIGIDLCDEYITAYNIDDQKLLSVPDMVCREKREDLWYIGEEAYRLALSGRGVLTEKLLSLLKKDGTSTIQRKVYTAEVLLSKLIGTVMDELISPASILDVERLVISLKSPEKKDMDACIKATTGIGIDRQKVSVISHEEAFIHYMLSQDRKLIYNMSGLFDLSGENLSFYRMRAVRGNVKISYIAESIDPEETFRLGIIKNDSGSEIGDRILVTAAKKYLKNDIYSSILLTGKGFESTSWAGNFIKFICQKRKVIYEDSLFAIGASLYARSLNQAKASDVLLFCDTRTINTVSLNVTVNDRRAKLVMVSAGSSWYEVDTYAELIPKSQKYVDIEIDSVDRYKPSRTLRMELSDFPVRPDRCTRISVEIKFLNLNTLQIEIKDLGFGEIFPSSGKSVIQTFNL